jgi:S-adenosylmethionine decarboxylase proenzyme
MNGTRVRRLSRRLLAVPEEPEAVESGESDYCAGLSLNVDFFWNQRTDVSFLTMRGKDGLINSLAGAVQAGHMKIFDKRLTSYGNDPEFGFTYLIVLGQSHLIIHTWPEKYMMNLDVFTCGTEGDPKAIVEYLKTKLRPEHVQINQAQRGVRKHMHDASEFTDTPAQIN